MEGRKREEKKPRDSAEELQSALDEFLWAVGDTDDPEASRRGGEADRSPNEMSLDDLYTLKKEPADFKVQPDDVDETARASHKGLMEKAFPSVYAMW